MNKLTEIKGICPIVAAPFTDNGEVDYESLDKLVKHLLNGGCHAVTLFGIACEYYKLSDDEREKMAQVTIKAAKEVGGKLLSPSQTIQQRLPLSVPSILKNWVRTA